MKGYWNGEPATFIGVTYEVTKSEGELHWQNLHVGSRRQGIQITYQGETWIIDNENGDGYYKVTKGYGSPRCGHKSIFNSINIVIIEDLSIITIYNHIGLKLESLAQDEFIKKANPAEFQKLQGLREMIKKLHSHV
jgi:hypothetical protein